MAFGISPAGREAMEALGLAKLVVLIAVVALVVLEIWNFWNPTISHVDEEDEEEFEDFEEFEVGDCVDWADEGDVLSAAANVSSTLFGSGPFIIIELVVYGEDECAVLLRHDHVVQYPASASMDGDKTALVPLGLLKKHAA